ncbi:MAG: hypothetical protein A2W09_02915 [Deltaproteobacteria bacterium RBG_16_50_11]|nr:MAG: hypothetical protein A2W09_02915 [Deltaproteobacteria bacterium RBG_16_50_11]
METLVRTFEVVNHFVTKVLLVVLFTLFAGTVSLLFVQVIGRYFFGFSPVWVVETAQYSFIWLSFLGISIAFRKKAHISVDLVIDYSPPTMRNRLRFAIHLLILFTGLAMTYSGIEVVRSLKDTVSPGMQISMAWPYSGAVACGLFIVLFGLESSFKALGPVSRESEVGSDSGKQNVESV